MENDDVITWQGLRNGLVLGTLSWIAFGGGIYLAWRVFTS